MNVTSLLQVTNGKTKIYDNDLFKKMKKVSHKLGKDISHKDNKNQNI